MNLTLDQWRALVADELRERRLKPTFKNQQRVIGDALNSPTTDRLRAIAKFMGHENV
jgi:hypothetical protein